MSTGRPRLVRRTDASAADIALEMSWHRHRGRNQAARYQETAVQFRQWWLAVLAGTVYQQRCSKCADWIDGETGVLEAEPAAGKWIPRLVDRFLRAEQ